jgi:hypothetical protein
MIRIIENFEVGDTVALSHKPIRGIISQKFEIFSYEGIKENTIYELDVTGRITYDGGGFMRTRVVITEKRIF